MQISNVDCAVLFDEENCDTSSDSLRVKPGDWGRLSKWSPFTSSLQRNDLESLIVRDHCKLELWDDDDGIDNRQPPDFVIDNTVNIHVMVIINRGESFETYSALFCGKIY